MKSHHFCVIMIHLDVQSIDYIQYRKNKNRTRYQVLKNEFQHRC